MKTLLCALVLLASTLAFGQVTGMATSGSPSPSLNGTGAPSARYTCNSNFLNIQYYQSDGPIGQRLWFCDGVSWNQNAGVSLYGNYLEMLNQTATMSSQTLCAATTACPAGFYHVDISIEVTSAATLVSTITASLAYTNSATVARSVNPTGCTALSLVTVTDYSCGFTFYHAANTTITTTTSLVALTGTPSYNYRAQLSRLH